MLLSLSHEHVPSHRIASACCLPSLYLSRISTGIFLTATAIAGSRCQRQEGGGVECRMVCAFCLMTADQPDRVRPQQLAGNCVSRSQRDLSAAARKQSAEPGRALRRRPLALVGFFALAAGVGGRKEQDER